MGKHEKKLIATKNNFVLEVEGFSGDKWDEHFLVRFYICDNCKTRTARVVGAKGPFGGWKDHRGVVEVVDNWKEGGILPPGSTLFNKAYYHKQLEILEALQDDDSEE